MVHINKHVFKFMFINNCSLYRRVLTETSSVYPDEQVSYSLIGDVDCLVTYGGAEQNYLFTSYGEVKKGDVLVYLLDNSYNLNVGDRLTYNNINYEIIDIVPINFLNFNILQLHCRRVI